MDIDIDAGTTDELFYHSYTPLSLVSSASYSAQYLCLGL